MKALGMVFFGSTKEQGRYELSLLASAAESLIDEETLFAQSYSSRIVTRRLAQRGTLVDSPLTMAAKLFDAGAQELFLAPSFLTDGHEMADLVGLVRGLGALEGKYSFRSVAHGRPLLTDDESVRLLASAVGSDFASLTEKGPVLFMGHGTDNVRGNELYLQLASELEDLHLNLRLACVEGEPSFELALERLKKEGAKTVTLAPLMMVFGEHAQKDLAGSEPESWASQLKTAGFEVEVWTKGLAQSPAVVELWRKRLMEDMTGWNC